MRMRMVKLETYAWGKHAPFKSCRLEPVVGLHFNQDSVNAAVVSLNGTVLQRISIPGSVAYKALMQRWFELCRTVHDGVLSPEEARESETAKLPRLEEPKVDHHKPHLWPERYWWDWIQVELLGFKEPEPPRVPNAYENDTDVTILSSMMATLEPALRAHRSKGTVLYGGPARPLYAEIALPFYFFNSHRPPPPEGGHDSWHYFTADDMWTGVLSSKFSVATTRAGFHLSQYSVSEISIHSEMDQSRSHAYPSPFAAILGADPTYSCMVLWRGMPCKDTQLPLVTILNVDFSHSSLSLFAEPRGGSGGLKLPWIPWNTWPGLGGNALSVTPDTPTFWKKVVGKVEDLLRDVKPGLGRGNAVKVVLSGDALFSAEISRSMKSALEAVLGPDIWMHQQSDPGNAVSVGAARLANEKRLDYCEGGGLINRDEL